MNNITALNTAPLLTAECCSNCKFVRQWPNGDLKCHRNPATALLFMGKSPDGKIGHMGTAADWPPVVAQQWCGEYKRKVLVDALHVVEQKDHEHGAS